MRSSLLLRLYLLVGLALAPALLLLAYNHQQLVTSRQVAADAEALRYARLISDEVSRLIEGARGMMAAAAASPVVVARNEPECSQYLHSLVNVLPSTTSISIFDLDGAEICRDVGPLPNVKDRSYFQEALRTGAFSVGELIIGRTSRLAVVPISAPLRNEEGKIVGVVATTIKIDWLRSYFERKMQDLPANTAITMADRTGHILMRLPTPLEPGTPMRLFSTIGKDVDGGSLRTEQGDAFDGVARFVGYTKSPEGLYVVVGIPRETVLAGLNEVSLRNLLLMVLVALIAIVAAHFGGQALFVGPVRDLQASANQWRQGKMSARVKPPATTELNDLAHAFNDMAADLEQALQHKDVLLREMSHRVMNSLQTISSLFTLQARTTTDQTSRNYLNQAITRINSMALAYRRLHASEGIEVIEFSALLRELSRELSQAMMPDGNETDVQADPVLLSPDQAVPLALVVNELLTNAIKYGSLPIIIRLGRSSEGCRLAVRNRGTLPADFSLDGTRRFGIRMVVMMVQRLGGRIETSSASGEVEFAVTFPLKTPQPTAFGVVKGGLDFG
jgi:two-component sensor histidine kinase